MLVTNVSLLNLSPTLKKFYSIQIFDCHLGRRIGFTCYAMGNWWVTELGQGACGYLHSHFHVCAFESYFILKCMVLVFWPLATVWRRESESMERESRGESTQNMSHTTEPTNYIKRAINTMEIQGMGLHVYTNMEVTAIKTSQGSVCIWSRRRHNYVYATEPNDATLAPMQQNQITSQDCLYSKTKWRPNWAYTAEPDDVTRV